MSHEYARAFGTIAASLWPMNQGDRDRALLNLATLITQPSDNGAKVGEDLKATADHLLSIGLTHDFIRTRMHAWRTACVVMGVLPTDIEVRFDLILQHLRDTEPPNEDR